MEIEMNGSLYDLLSNIGDDLVAMSKRRDKSIVFAKQKNAVRWAAFDALREAGFVTLKDDDGLDTVTVTLVFQ